MVSDLNVLEGMNVCMWTFVERLCAPGIAKRKRDMEIRRERVREKERERKRERGRMRELVLVFSLLFSTSKILKQKRKNLTNKKRNLIFLHRLTSKSKFLFSS